MMLSVYGTVKTKNGDIKGTITSYDLTEKELDEIIRITRGKLIFKDNTGNFGTNFTVGYY